MNCHEATETADFLGSLRPVGDGSFRWLDGIVVQAMKKGKPLLIDEISLAADSVGLPVYFDLTKSWVVVFSPYSACAFFLCHFKGFSLGIFYCL